MGGGNRQRRVVAIIGGVLERFVLRELGNNPQGQVLVTLGLSFIFRTPA